MIFDIDNHSRAAQPALHDPRRGWVSYGELAAEVAACRVKLELAAPALAFCFCRNTSASVTTYLASLEAGVAVALLDADMDPALRANLEQVYRPEVVFDDDGPTPVWRIAGTPAEAVHPELSVLLSTSGSTGSPKFVRLSRRNIEANAGSIATALGIGAGERAALTLPMSYSYGLSVLNTHLLRGASVVLTDGGLMAASLWDRVRAEDCTSMPGVPYSYQILRRLDLNVLKVPRLLTLTQAGGKLARELALHYHALQVSRGGRFFVMYGQTEATARIAILPHERLADKPDSAGLAIPGGRLLVRTAEGECTAEPGVRGEVIYEGPNVMMGYATNRADLAAGDELGGVLATGDTGYLDEEGFVYIAGRAKRDAKVFGLRINMDEVEGLLKHHGPTAVVAGKSGLVIYADYGSEADLASLRTELSQRLRVHHSALEFRRIHPLPVTSSGKTDYARLAEMKV